MSEKEQREYKKETSKRPMYFNKPSNEFKDWLKKRDKETDEEKVETVILDKELKKQLIIQEMEEGIQMVINEEKTIRKSSNLKREKKSLKDYFNVDINKAKERVKKEKDEKRQANMIWQREKSNQKVNNLIEFVAKLN